MSKQAFKEAIFPAAEVALTFYDPVLVTHATLYRVELSAQAFRWTEKLESVIDSG